MEKRTRKKPRMEKPPDTNAADIQSDISDDDKFSDDEEGGIRIDDIYIPPAPPPVCSYENTGPRLVITRVINDNFKSYGGRVSVGPFDTSFACIVGPNGSGKSNVIDSMLFVFGYRATKIRSKKVSVLIHKSTEFPDCASCRVEVHFAVIIDKEDGDYEVVPNSEFVIARTAFKNNSSFYEIDGKRVQFKEVAMLLRHYGVDLVHNRFLILQGEVEQIALMKPKGQHPNETGMLEYLEDIIGTTRYKEPIEKLQARIEALNEERQEKLNRLKVVESEREALKGPMEETVRFLQTENRITHLKNKKYQYQLHKINKIIAEMLKEKEEIDEEYKSLNDKLKEIQDQRGNEKSEMDSLNKTLQKMIKKHEEFNEIHQNAEKRNTGLIEESKQLKKNQKKTAENLKTEEDKLKKLLEIPEKNQQQIEKLTEEEAELNVRRQEEEAAFQTVMSSLQQETKAFQQEKDKLQAEQIKLKKKYDDMRSAFELAKSERDIYVSTEQKEKAKLEQLVQKLNETKEALDARKSELSELRKELPAKEQTLKKAEDHLRNIKTKGEAISNDLRQYNSQLLEKKSSMSASRSRNRVIDFLMRLKMEGKIPGIFGRLGDLGGIDKKYDVAISTACSMLDFVVVDSPETSNRCIKALKENNVGNGNFMVLSTVNRGYSEERVARYTAPSNSSRLFDLIRVNDERVRPAFYFSLRDTLVADDLDIATKIAYGKTRHRVVTLNGELIEITGTMSGGGTQVMRGKMGTSVSVSTDTSTTEEVNNLERRVNVLEGQMQQFREQEQECENVISRLGPEIRTMQMNANKFKIEVEGLSKQYPELQNQVKSQEKKVKECAPNENRLHELYKKVEDTEKGARKAEKEVNTIDEKVNAVHEKIMEITGGKTKEAQQKLDEVTKRWEKTRSTITQLQVAIRTSERNAKKAQERIENMKIELEEAAKREAEITEEKETVENDCKVSMEKATKLQEEIDEKKARLEELQEEHKNFMQEVNKLKASIVKEEQKIENIEKKINDTKKDVPVVQQKLEKLALHKIPVFNEPVEDEGENDQQRETDTPPAERDVLITYEIAAFGEMSQSEINNQLQTEEEYLKTLSPNLNTLKDYEKKTQQYIERSNELKEITERRNVCRQGYEEARKNRHQEFMTGFNIISNKLKELYQMLTMGGDAELDLNDSLDPFTEGISFCVRPPKKSWKIITNLSGGEKTLSSLALVFALHYYRPTPLYVMDEIDAALDFRNVSIVGYYIKERTKNAQFIVISLRTNMFELGVSLTGIYKPKNSTRSTTVRPDELGIEGEPKDSKISKKNTQRPATIEATQARARPTSTNLVNEERPTTHAAVPNDGPTTTVTTATVHEEPRTEPKTGSRSGRSATVAKVTVHEEPRTPSVSASNSPGENSNARKRKRSEENSNRKHTEASNTDSEDDTLSTSVEQPANAPIDLDRIEIVPDDESDDETGAVDLSAIDQDSDEEEILREFRIRKRQEKQAEIENSKDLDNTVDTVSSSDINLLSEIQSRRRANKK